LQNIHVSYGYISIDFTNLSINLWANKLRTVIRVQWSGGPLGSDYGMALNLPGMAKFKINVAQRKFISELAFILVKQDRDMQWQQYQ